MEDRRKHQRFKLHDGCILNHSEIVGTILDISLGGLSCMCLNPDKCSNQSMTKVDIYCRRHNLWAEGIGIQVLNTDTEPGQFIPKFGTRKCRAQFVLLEEQQLAQLENIILQYSIP